MRYILLLFLFVYHAGLAQQKEGSVSISCYVNPELYIQANVIAHVSDKSGNISCNGKYVTINNKSRNSFYYKRASTWVLVKPQAKTILLLAGANAAASKSPSVYKLSVRYKLDTSGSMSAKLMAISQMNAQSDKVQARELAELKQENSNTQQKVQNKPSSEALAKLEKPSEEPSKKAPVTTANKDIAETDAMKTSPKTTSQQTKPKPTPEKKTAVAKAQPRKPAKQSRTEAAPEKQEVRNVQQASSNAVGLRVDFGSGSAGLGPNINHRFKRNLSLDAAIVFFEGDLVGIGAQVEQNFPLKGVPELNWYIGIGPQLLVANENTDVALVPVTGLEYNIPDSPLNFSFDWRPNFYLSPDANVQTGRFGLSLRLAF